MTFENVLQMATLGTVICGICGIMVAIKGYRRQINARLLTEFANRFDDLVQGFPGSSWADRFNAEEDIYPESKELAISVSRFMRFLDGAHFLYRRGYLDRHAWAMWQSEIRRTLRTPMFQRELKQISNEQLLSPEFRKFVTSCLGSTGRSKSKRKVAKRA